MGTFWRIYFWKVLHLLWTFFRIIFGFWAGKVWPASQNCFFCIYKIILKKELFSKTNEIFHSFQTLSRMFSASCRVLRRGCSNCILRVQGNILKKNGSASKFFSYLDTEQYFWSILKKNIGNVKTGFSVSMEISAGCRKKISGLWSCFLPLHRNILKKIILKSFCIFCGLFSDHLR